MGRRAYTSTLFRKMRRKAFDRQEWFRRRSALPPVQSIACVSLTSIKQILQRPRARRRAVLTEMSSPVTSPILARRGILVSANTPRPAMALRSDRTGYLIMGWSELDIPQVLRGVLGRRRIDVESRPPLEPCRACQAGHDLHVPVEVVLQGVPVTA